MGSTHAPVPPSTDSSGTCKTSPLSAPVSTLLPRRWDPIGSFMALGGSSPPRSHLQTRQGLSLTRGSPEPFAGFPAGFVLCSCHTLTLRWEKGLGCSPRSSIFWCQPCRGSIAWQFNPNRLPELPAPRGLHPSLGTDGSAPLHAQCWDGGGQKQKLEPGGVSPFLLPLQTTARMRKRCWEPATAARVSATLRVPALPLPAVASVDPNPQLLHPKYSKGNVKPGNARPFSLQLKPATPAEAGMWVPGHQYATGFYWGAGRKKSRRGHNKAVGRSARGKSPLWHRGEGERKK